ncbi:MAG: alpha-amylase family glycosyl hydrolase, partial [Anaerolineales bacterium]
KDWPLRPYTSDKDNPLNYAAWWGMPALPKLNTDNPGVRHYLFDAARYWIEFGIDGWRIDVPTEIDDDGFWREFRRVVKDANPEAYICGEIWHPAQRWLQGDMFDSVMNYIFTRAALCFFGAKTLTNKWNHQDLHPIPLDAPGFAAAIDRMHSLYDWEINHVQLNLIDSHDMPRALWLMGEDQTALRLAVLFQMTMPGAPCIYYGDEIGMSAAGDPYCREAFPWHKPKTWDGELLDFYKRAIALRRQHPVLRTGTFEPLTSALRSDERERSDAQGQVYAFRRTLGDQQAIVAFNAETRSQTIQIPNVEHPLTPVWPDAGERTWAFASPIVSTDSYISLTLPAREGVVLLSSNSQYGG